MADVPDIFLAAASDKEAAVSLYEAWGLYLLAMRQRPELHASFEKKLKINGAKTRSLEDEGFRRSLLEFAQEFSRVILQQQEEVSQLSDLQAGLVPLEILARAAHIASDKEAFSALYKKGFISRLVGNYVTQLSNQNLIENEGAGELKKRLALRLSGVSEEQNETAFVNEALREIREEMQNAQAVAVARQVFAQETVLDEIHAYYERDKAFQRIREAVIDAPVDHPDLYAALLVSHTIEHPLVAIEQTKEVVAQQVRLAEVLAAASVDSPMTTPEASAAASTFFQSFADTGAKRALAPFLDAFVSVFGPETQFAVADILAGKALKKTLDRTQKGGLAEISPGLLSGLSEKTQLHVKTLEQAHKGKRGLRTSLFLSSLFGFEESNTIFEKPLAVQGLRNNHGALLEGLTQKIGGLPRLLRSSTALELQAHAVLLLEHFWITSHNAVFAIIHQGSPRATHLEFGSAGSWVVRWGANRVAGIAAGGLKKWAVKTSVGKIIGGVLGAFAGPLGVAAGIFLGDAAGRALGKVRSFLAGLANLFGLGYAGGRSRHDDLGSFGFVFLIVVVPLVLVVLLSFQSMSMIASAFSVTSQRPIGGDARANTLVTYVGAVPPQSTPVAPLSGRITQTPFEAGTTHERTNAIDIAAPAGATVGAACDGYLASYGTGNTCLQDKDLGYYRVLVCANSQNALYETLYAHLLAGCGGNVDDAVFGDATDGRQPDLVKRGTHIGRVGSTGRSSGPHLHFQINGPGEMRGMYPQLPQ